MYPDGGIPDGPVSVSPIKNGVIGTAAILGMVAGFLLSLRGSRLVRQPLLGPDGNSI